MTEQMADETGTAASSPKALTFRESVGIIVQERFLAYLTTSIFLVLAATMEWLRAKYDLPPAPWIWTGMAAVAVILTTVKFILLHRQLARTKGTDEPAA